MRLYSGLSSQKCNGITWSVGTRAGTLGPLNQLMMGYEVSLLFFELVLSQSDEADLRIHKDMRRGSIKHKMVGGS